MTSPASPADAFSSRNVSVVPPPDETEGELFPAGLPPIQADPPVHTWSRRLVRPWFSYDRVAEYEPYTRGELCRSLLDRFASTGRADAAGDYAKQIPVRVIGKILGIPEEKSDTFYRVGASVLEFATDVPRRNQAQIESAAYFIELMNQRRGGDGTDLISELLRADVDGNAVPDDFVLGVVALVLIAGLDTTWSALGSMLLHLASIPTTPDAPSHGDRGDAAGLLTRHDGPHRRRRRGPARLPGEAGRPGTGELPGRQPRSGRLP
jgi:cytochrome P450